MYSGIRADVAERDTLDLRKNLLQRRSRLIPNLRNNQHCFDASIENLLEAFHIDFPIIVGQRLDHAAKYLDGQLFVAHCGTVVW